MTDSSKPSTLSLLSRILELEFGETRLQHYGLFEGSDATVQSTVHELIDGQQRFAALLVDLIANQRSRLQVLLVGDSLLPMAGSLLEAEHSVFWCGSQNLLGESLDAAANFHYVGEDFVATQQPTLVDVLLYGGSMRYLDQMAILSKSRDLLGASGRLLLFSEFLHDDSRIEYSALANLSSFEQLSRRLGFRQIQNRDLSLSAARTLDLVQPLLARHGAAVAGNDASATTLLQELQADFATMREEFAVNRRGFHLFVLDRDQQPVSEWSNVEFGDIHSFQPLEVADLFEKSFGVEFNEELWYWKYAQGDGKCVVARLGKNSDIVAHYGGAPREIVYFGEPSMAIQPCDVMVHPSIRKQYGKGSLFFEVAATFLEREIGNTVNHLLGFGFPNQKTMNISKRLGLYEKTDDFIEVAYPLSQDSEKYDDYSVVEYTAQDVAAREELDGLWAAMKADYSDGIIGIRDAQYIQHRYLDHPFSKTGQYRCVFLREGSPEKTLAFAVLKEHDGGKLLMDLICPVVSMKKAISILKQELRKSSADGVLRLWLTRSGKDKVCISGAIVNELGIEIPCNSWNPGPSAERLYGAWWLTAGDMDFI